MVYGPSDAGSGRVLHFCRNSGVVVLVLDLNLALGGGRKRRAAKEQIRLRTVSIAIDRDLAQRVGARNGFGPLDTLSKRQCRGATAQRSGYA